MGMKRSPLDMDITRSDSGSAHLEGRTSVSSLKKTRTGQSPSRHLPLAGNLAQRFPFLFEPLGPDSPAQFFPGDSRGVFSGAV